MEGGGRGGVELLEGGRGGGVVVDGGGGGRWACAVGDVDTSCSGGREGGGLVSEGAATGG